MTYQAMELSENQFRKVCTLVYHHSGINLKTGKEALVKTRLAKRLRALNLKNYDDYLSLVESKNGDMEIGWMIDVMTTNQTSFFREPAHFSFLSEQVLPRFENKKFRLWSAACSSGQEPYSIAMVIKNSVSDACCRDYKILGTDISTTMLSKARQGVYPMEQLRSVNPDIIRKHFECLGEKQKNAYRMKQHVSDMIHFSYLNLLNEWPMKGPFHVIFCRNVMIYFDRKTQQELVSRFWGLLETGGYLFVGHSEGLSAVKHKFHYVKPAVYRK
jgi:chemotaxis protein methyltransferase CheR